MTRTILNIPGTQCTPAASRPQWRRGWIVVCSAVLVTLLGVRASARTIVFTDSDADVMGCLTADAPRQSWASFPGADGVFASIYLDLSSDRSFLIRIPLDKIPKGQHITKAELLSSVSALVPLKPRLYVWRLLPEWGPGVCHQYRTAGGAGPEPWAVPGAKANATDRAATPTTVATIDGAGPVTLNVTQDVELWYSGGAPNHGWMVSVEDANCLIRLGSPQWSAGDGTWKLRITYEPE